MRGADQANASYRVKMEEREILGSRLDKHICFQKICFQKNCFQKICFQILSLILQLIACYSSLSQASMR